MAPLSHSHAAVPEHVGDVGVPLALSSPVPLPDARAAAGRERRALCAARSFVSLLCCRCSALAASSTPQLSRIAVCCFFFFLENRATPRHPVQFPRVMPQLGLEKQKEDEVLPSGAVLYMWVAGWLWLI